MVYGGFYSVTAGKSTPTVEKLGEILINNADVFPQVWNCVMGDFFSPNVN